MYQENLITMEKNMVERLREYLANTSKEQQEKDWEELKKWNEVGPTVEEFLAAQGRPTKFSIKKKK